MHQGRGWVPHVLSGAVDPLTGCRSARPGGWACLDDPQPCGWSALCSHYTRGRAGGLLPPPVRHSRDHRCALCGDAV